VSEISLAPGILRQVRRNCGELRRLEAKRYIRGKFEGWFLVQFIKRLVEALSAVARQSGGSISVVVPLEDSNYVQVLASCLSVPNSLATFLAFHIRAHQQPSSEPRQGWLVTFLKQLFK